MAKDSLDEEIGRFLEAWMGVRQLIQAANFNRFQREGLSATQFMTLNLLPVNPEGLTLSELARRMNLSLSTLTKTIDSLEGRGLVARTRSDADRRSTLLTLTADGMALQNAASKEFKAQMGNLFRAMKPKQRLGLIDGLEGLVAASGSGVDTTRGQDGVVRRKRSSPRSRQP